MPIIFLISMKKENNDNMSPRLSSHTPSQLKHPVSTSNAVHAVILKNNIKKHSNTTYK